MKQIIYHSRNYLGSNNLVLNVDEEQVHFINGIAAVNATVVGQNGRENETISGIINEAYQEVFDDKSQCAWSYAGRYLMFIPYNKNILRCGENDFIVTVRQGDENHWYYAYKHIRIKDMKATLVNEDIGECFKTNDENILIIGGVSNWHNKKLYNIAKGEHIDGHYDEISIIDGYPNRFAVKKYINSLTEDSSKGEDLYLTDDLYFQIDQNGHIISKIFSKRKLEFLDYGDTPIDDYPSYRKQELVEESQKLKAAVHSLRYYKK